MTILPRCMSSECTKPSPITVHRVLLKTPKMKTAFLRSGLIFQYKIFYDCTKIALYRSLESIKLVLLMHTIVYINYKIVQ